MRRTPLPALLLVLFASSTGAHAAESFDACRGYIASLPAVITSQGTWCLDGDLATAQSNGFAIDVQANNVTIDCNGYKLGGLSAPEGSITIGIHAAGRGNTTVRGCNLRGFHSGVDLSGFGHLVENNRIEASRRVGIRMDSTPGIIRGNLVFDTDDIALAAQGIVAAGDIDILDNTVDGVGSTLQYGTSYGILALETLSSTIQGNRVRNVFHRDPLGQSVGISLSQGVGSGRSVVRGNDVIAVNDGSASVGISCDGAAFVTVGNVLSGWLGTDAGCKSQDDIVIP